jgi:hypothetical protein
VAAVFEVIADAGHGGIKEFSLCFLARAGGQQNREQNHKPKRQGAQRKSGVHECMVAKRVRRDKSIFAIQPRKLRKKRVGVASPESYAADMNRSIPACHHVF